MAKFVKLHVDGYTLMVNLDKIITIEASDGGKTIMQADDCYIKVDDSFYEVMEIVGAAQGGIPMEPSKMY